MYQNAYLPAVGENGGVHRVSGYHMGCAVDGVTPSIGQREGPAGGAAHLHLIGPASSGDAMDLWQQSQAEGRPYFASTTEV